MRFTVDNKVPRTAKSAACKIHRAAMKDLTANYKNSFRTSMANGRKLSCVSNLIRLE